MTKNETITSFEQINLFQKDLLLHELTHNMTKDCSCNYRENYKRRTWTKHYELVVFISKNNQLSYCWLIDYKDLPVQKMS